MREEEMIRLLRRSRGSVTVHHSPQVPHWISTPVLLVVIGWAFYYLVGHGGW